MTDPSFANLPLKGVPKEDLPLAMRSAFKTLADRFPPGTGLILFAFDFGEGGAMAYISNANRDDAIGALAHWMQKQGL